MARESRRRSREDSRRRRRDRERDRERRSSRDRTYTQNTASTTSSYPFSNPPYSSYPAAAESSYRRSDRRRSYSSTSSSGSSSVASSLLDISRHTQTRKYGGIFGTFFRAPSERRRRVGRRTTARSSKRRNFYFGNGNSSSSSVNSDLAYGNGYIPKRKSSNRNLNAASGIASGRYRTRDRDGYESASRPGGPARSKTDEEILSIGRQLSDLAREQNKHDLKAAGISKPSTMAAGAAALYALHKRKKRNSSPRSRGIGSSKPHGASSSDESDWESASDDDDSDDANSHLAYGSTVGSRIGPRAGAAAGALAGAAGAAYIGHEMHDRKSSIVDPRLFGPVNSLHGMINTPCGFDDPGSANDSRYQAAVNEQRYGGSSGYNNGPMREVYPVPTSDPTRYDVDLPHRSRPEPVPLQQPIPKTPVSSKVYNAERLEYSTRRDSRPGRDRSDSHGISGSAAAGLTAAAIGAVALASDRKDDRKDKRSSRDYEGERERERDRDRESKRRDKESDRERERRRSKRDSYTSKYDDPQDHKRSARQDDYDGQSRKRRELDDDVRTEKSVKSSRGDRDRRDKDRNRDRDNRSEVSRSSRRDTEKLSKREERDVEYSKPKAGDREAPGNMDPQSSTKIDPFQFQVDDDDFMTPPLAKVARPLTPNIVTVSAEPNFDDDDFHVPLPHNESRLSRKDSFELEQMADKQGSTSKGPGRYRDPQTGHAYEEGEHAASAIWDEARHATVPVAAGALAAAIAIEGERSRERRLDDYDADGSRERSAKHRDTVQEEADRYYRESVIARKIEEERKRGDNPGRSVVERWEDDTQNKDITIVTPPEMEDREKKTGPYDGPNADVRIDNQILPEEEYKFRATSGKKSKKAKTFKSRDPSCERDRPMLNLVLPTPVPTPAPEKQEEKQEEGMADKKAAKNSKEEKSKESSRSIDAEPEVVVGPKGHIMQNAAANKSVTWGENSTKRFEVESPSPDSRSDFEIEKKDVAQEDSSESRKDSPPSKEKSRSRLAKGSQWGILAAAIAGSSKEPDNELDQASNVSSSSKRSSTSKALPLDDNFSAMGPDQVFSVDIGEQPPVPGPKPASPQAEKLPGSYADDIEFAATLAAGLKDSGFDSNIVIDDPTYRRRDSPPGAKEANGDDWRNHSSFSDIVTDATSRKSYDRAVASEPGGRNRDRDLASPKEKATVDDELFEKKLSKKEKKKLDKLRRQSADAAEPSETASPVDSVNFEDAFENQPKLSKKEQKKRDKEAKARALLPEGEDTFEAGETERGPEREPELEQSSAREATDDVWEESSSKKKKKKNRKSRDLEDEQVTVPADAFDDLQSLRKVDNDDDWDTPSKSKRRSMPDFESYSKSGAGSEVSETASKKSSKSSKRRSLNEDALKSLHDSPTSDRKFFDDREVHSVVSESRGDERRRSKKSSRYDDDDDAKSVVSAPGGSRKSKDKESTSKRSSGLFASIFKGKDDDKKDSFLDNAGTLGAGAGLAGAAAIIASSVSRSNAAQQSAEHAKDVSGERQPASEYEALDPEIVPRAIKPAIDPQYGDLLPLPPSEPGSPQQSPEELPALPDSRPDTPPEERALKREQPSHRRRRSTQDAHTKSPSSTAIPISLRLGQRSNPSSPGAMRSPPMSSPPSNTSPESVAKRLARGTSWDSSREIKPLYLLEHSRQGSTETVVRQEDLPALPPSEPSEPPSRDEVDPGFHTADEAEQEVGGLASGGLHIQTDNVPKSIDDLAGSQETTPKAEAKPQFPAFEGTSAEDKLILPDVSEDFTSADEHFSDAVEAHSRRGSEDASGFVTLPETTIAEPLSEPRDKTLQVGTEPDEWAGLSAKQKKKLKKARKASQSLDLAEPTPPTTEATGDRALPVDEPVPADDEFETPKKSKKSKKNKKKEQTSWDGAEPEPATLFTEPELSNKVIEAAPTEALKDTEPVADAPEPESTTDLSRDMPGGEQRTDDVWEPSSTKSKKKKKRQTLDSWDTEMISMQEPEVRSDEPKVEVSQHVAKEAAESPANGTELEPVEAKADDVWSEPAAKKDKKKKGKESLQLDDFAAEPANLADATGPVSDTVPDASLEVGDAVVAEDKPASDMPKELSEPQDATDPPQAQETQPLQDDGFAPVAAKGKKKKKEKRKSVQWEPEPEISETAAKDESSIPSASELLPAAAGATAAGIGLSEILRSTEAARENDDAEFDKGVSKELGQSEQSEPTISEPLFSQDAPLADTQDAATSFEFVPSEQPPVTEPSGEWVESAPKKKGNKDKKKRKSQSNVWDLIEESAKPADEAVAEKPEDELEEKSEEKPAEPDTATPALDRGLTEEPSLIEPEPGTITEEPAAIEVTSPRAEDEWGAPTTSKKAKKDKKKKKRESVTFAEEPEVVEIPTNTTESHLADTLTCGHSSDTATSATVEHVPAGEAETEAAKEDLTKGDVPEEATAEPVPVEEWPVALSKKDKKKKKRQSLVSEPEVAVGDPVETPAELIEQPTETDVLAETPTESAPTEEWPVTLSKKDRKKKKKRDSILTSEPEVVSEPTDEPVQAIGEDVSTSAGPEDAPADSAPAEEWPVALSKKDKKKKKRQSIYSEPDQTPAEPEELVEAVTEELPHKTDAREQAIADPVEPTSTEEPAVADEWPVALSKKDKKKKKKRESILASMQDSEPEAVAAQPVDAADDDASQPYATDDALAEPTIVEATGEFAPTTESALNDEQAPVEEEWPVALSKKDKKKKKRQSLVSNTDNEEPPVEEQTREALELANIATETKDIDVEPEAEFEMPKKSKKGKKGKKTSVALDWSSEEVPKSPTSEGIEFENKDINTAPNEEIATEKDLGDAIGVQPEAEATAGEENAGETPKELESQGADPPQDSAEDPSNDSEFLFPVKLSKKDKKKKKKLQEELAAASAAIEAEQADENKISSEEPIPADATADVSLQETQVVEEAATPEQVAAEKETQEPLKEHQEEPNPEDEWDTVSRKPSKKDKKKKEKAEIEAEMAALKPTESTEDSVQPAGNAEVARNSVAETTTKTSADVPTGDLEADDSWGLGLSKKEKKKLKKKGLAAAAITSAAELMLDGAEQAEKQSADQEAVSNDPDSRTESIEMAEEISAPPFEASPENDEWFPTKLSKKDKKKAKKLAKASADAPEPNNKTSEADIASATEDPQDDSPKEPVASSSWADEMNDADDWMSPSDQPAAKELDTEQAPDDGGFESASSKKKAKKDKKKRKSGLQTFELPGEDPVPVATVEEQAMVAAVDEPESDKQDLPPSADNQPAEATPGPSTETQADDEWALPTKKGKKGKKGKRASTVDTPSVEPDPEALPSSENVEQQDVPEELTSSVPEAPRESEVLTVAEIEQSVEPAATQDEDPWPVVTKKKGKKGKKNKSISMGFEEPTEQETAEKETFAELEQVASVDAVDPPVASSSATPIEEDDWAAPKKKGKKGKKNKSISAWEEPSPEPGADASLKETRLDQLDSSLVTDAADDIDSKPLAFNDEPVAAVPVEAAAEDLWDTPSTKKKSKKDKKRESIQSDMAETQLPEEPKEKAPPKDVWEIDDYFAPKTDSPPMEPVEEQSRAIEDKTVYASVSMADIVGQAMAMESTPLEVRHIDSMGDIVEQAMNEKSAFDEEPSRSMSDIVEQAMGKKLSVDEEFPGSMDDIVEQPLVKGLPADETVPKPTGKKSKKNRKGSVDTSATAKDGEATVESAAAATALTGGVAMLAEKFGGGKKKKPKQKKIVDKRSVREEDIFDDPALWESADKKEMTGDPLEEGGDGDFWGTSHESVDNEHITAKETSTSPPNDSFTESEGGWKETSRQGAKLEDDITESPILGRRESDLNRSAPSGLLRHESKSRESGHLLQEQPSLPSIITDSPRTSPTRGLPAVQEIPEAEADPANSDKWPTPELNRDSGFITDSPHPQRLRSPRLDSVQNRDSGVHSGDWTDSAGDMQSHESGAERRLRNSPKLREPAQPGKAFEDPEKRIGPASSKNYGAIISGTAGLSTAAAAAASMRGSSPSQEHDGRRIVSDSAFSGRKASFSDRDPQGRAEAVGGVAGARRSVSNSSLSRQRTPEPLKLRPDSPGIRASATPTPPLRRVDKRLSGDLRALRQQNNSTPPVANEGRVRSKDMADVYDGFGEGRIGSPKSPTRPHSMRRRQSMQVLELESKVEQLLAENRQLQEARSHAELNTTARSVSALSERDAEIDSLKQTLQYLQNEVARLTEVNDGLTSANAELASKDSGRYAGLHVSGDGSRGLDGGAGSPSLQQTLEEKDAEIADLRSQLEAAKEQVRNMQRKILESKAEDAEFLDIKDEDYFDHRCQQLCSHVQQWVLRFSKFSDMRACRLTSEINDEKTIDRLDNAVLDGSDVDNYLNDRVKRRDIFMSMTMNMIWEFVFTRYLFGMDREQRQKLKSLEKLLTEVGPPQAVRQWRAVTLTLLSRRESFKQQRDQDTEAVVQAIFQTLCKILPPPDNLEAQIQSQLRRVMNEAVDLSIEMRKQKAEYMMLPPLQPEYDADGELAATVQFNASMMNERSANNTVPNEDLEAQGSIVRVVLFPLVVKKGDDDGLGDDEIVVCPAQVIIAREDRRRHLTPGSDAGGASLGAPSRLSVVTEPMLDAQYAE